MFYSGIDRLFTGETGAVAHCVIILVISFLYSSCRPGRRLGRPVTIAGIGMALLVISRLCFSTPLADKFREIVLPGQVIGLVGYYLVFVPIVMGGGLYWPVRRSLVD